jgi:hypothetical protein
VIDIILTKDAQKENQIIIDIIARERTLYSRKRMTKKTAVGRWDRRRPFTT